MSEHEVELLSLQRAVVGRYSIVREIGRGGMGVVFLARDVALDRPVAIKVLPPLLAADRRFREQFLREARLAAGLAHPNIVPVHSVEELESHVFFVMGYVDGESLGARVQRLGPLPPREALSIVRQAAMGLAHAHARGVVHRDVKPDNILIEREGGRALVTDFGIARRMHDATEGGINAGTPHYLSPEVAAGAEGGAAADMYALGVTAWFALTGSHPHRGDSVAALLVEKVQVPAPAIGSAHPHLPQRLAAAIDRALAREPSARWPDLDRFAVELEASVSSQATPAVVRAFVRAASSLGRDTALSSGVVASALGVMALLAAGENLFNVIFAQAVMIPIATFAASFELIRLAQAATAAVDVVRQGHGHPVVAAAITQELRERELEADTRPLAERRRDAIYYGSLGAVKSAAAYFLAASSLPTWVTLPAAAVASIIPALTLVKVLDLLRPEVGRWPRWLLGRPGRVFFGMVAFFTRRPRSHQLPSTPTVVALGGEISALYEGLPQEARGATKALPRLVEVLQREADALRARPRSEDTDARLGMIATALETVRVELLSLQAGFGSVQGVTTALDHARAISERVDEAIGGLPEITPA